jgi:hypothetical protein
VAWAKAAIHAQKIEHSRWIARAVADVIGYAIGEALFGVGESHSVTRDWWLVTGENTKRSRSSATD